MMTILGAIALLAVIVGGIPLSPTQITAPIARFTFRVQRQANERS